MLNQLKKILRGKLVFNMIVVLVGGYLAAITLTSTRYGSLILHPAVIWHSVQITYLDLTKGDSEKPHRLTESFVESVQAYRSSQKVGQPLVSINEVERVSLDITEMEKEVEQLVASIKPAVSKDDSDLPALVKMDEIDLSGVKHSMSDSLENDGQERLALLPVGQSDVPTEQQINELLAKRSSSRQASGEIPQPVLQQVEQTTGISASEVQELLDRAP